jgi:hypothetical protein
MTQAIDRAQETLKMFEEGSKESKQLKATQREICNLRNDVKKVATWFWPVLVTAMAALGVTGLKFPPVAIMGYAVASLVVAALAPAKATLMDNIEEVRQSARSIANIEQLSIDIHDKRRHCALQSRIMLHNAMLAPNLEHSQVLVARDCQQKLNAEIEKAVKEIYERNQTYRIAESRFKKTEYVQGRAKGMNSTEIIMMVAEEGKKYTEEPKTQAQEKEESEWCPCCMAM